MAVIEDLSLHAGMPSGVSFDLVGALPAIVWEADAASATMLYVSPRASDIAGYDPEVWRSEPGFWEEHLHPDDRVDAATAADAAIRTGEATRIQYRFRVSDGSYRWFQDTIQAVPNDQDGRKIVGVMVDIHDERMHLEMLEELRARDATGIVHDPVFASPLHKTIVDGLSDGVYYVDRERRISYWNHGAERLTGFMASEVVGRFCYDNILNHVDATGRSLCHAACPLMKTMGDGQERQAIVWLRHAAGQRVPVETRTAPIRSAETGAVVGGVEIFSDATGLIEAKDAADAARHDALTDPLTGLPNRRLLDVVLAARRDDLDRHRLPFGFLMVDIDSFKRFNDEHGHDVGDRALKVVGTTLKGGLRSGDTLVRWGGEEFAIVTGQVDAEGMHRVADRLLRLIRATRVPVGEQRVPVRVSIGGALAHPGEPLEALFVRADQALLLAKGAGRDRFILNEPVAASAAPRQLGAHR